MLAKPKNTYTILFKWNTIQVWFKILQCFPFLLPAPLNRWVGGIYNWSRRQWTWGSSASDMSYSGFLTPQFPRSSRWHCLFLSPVINYRWNHDLCTQFMHYLCEAPLIRIPDPNEIVVAVNTNLWMASQAKCFVSFSSEKQLHYFFVKEEIYQPSTSQ